MAGMFDLIDGLKGLAGRVNLGQVTPMLWEGYKILKRDGYSGTKEEVARALASSPGVGPALIKYSHFLDIPGVAPALNAFAPGTSQKLQEIVQELRQSSTVQQPVKQHESTSKTDLWPAGIPRPPKR